MSTNIPTQLNNKVRCSCKGEHLDKMIQPKILIILSKGDLHGYLIIQALEEMSDKEKIDHAGVYRTLKNFEAKNLVIAKWDTNSSRGAKKIYHLNESGIDCLNNWIKTLEDYKNNIETIIANAKLALS